MLSFSPLIAITKSLAWSNGRPTMLENCSLVNRVTSVSPEPTESMTFVPVWTRLAVRDTEGYLVLRRQTCVFLAPSHSSSEPTVANRMYLPSELCAITSTQCPAVLLAPTNASAAPSRRAERDTEVRHALVHTLILRPFTVAFG